MAAINTEKLSTNNLILVMLLISLLAIGVAGVASKFLITTIVRDTKVAGKKITADNQLNDDTKAAPTLVQGYAALGTNKVLLGDALPNTVDFPGILVTLENMANVAGVTITTLTPPSADDGSSTAVVAPATDASTVPTPKVYKFSMETTGTYANLVKFLKNIELSARPFRVLDVALTGSGSVLSAQFDLQTYYQDKAVLPFSTEKVK